METADPVRRDKSRDDRLFCCFVKEDIDYVSSLYPSHEETVHSFILIKSSAGEIYHRTYMDLYKLIQREIGFPIP